MPVSTVWLLASIGVLSLFCQWLAWRVRMPAILFLLAGGIASGPVLGFLNPKDVFGDLLFPMVSLAVAIILFEGSLTLRFAEIRGHGKMVRNWRPAGSTGIRRHRVLGSGQCIWPLSVYFYQDHRGGHIFRCGGAHRIFCHRRFGLGPGLGIGHIDADSAGALVPLVFMLIIATVTIQSLTARPLADLLNVAEPSEFGFLILGANPVARMIGLTLKKHEVPVVLADTNWENVRQARMENLQVYFGNPVSEHASNQLDLTGVGNLLVISPYKHMNSLATYHFLDWFGDNSVYSLAEGDQDQKARHQTAEKIQQTRGLFNGVSYAKLASLVSQGYSVKTTELSDEFSYQNFLDKYQSQALVLFMFDGKGRITPVKSMDKLKPDEDSTLISLVPARAPKERKERKDRDNAEGNGANGAK